MHVHGAGYEIGRGGIVSSLDRVIEIVTSGVAGRGAVFGVVRENYAILTFDAEALHVELCSLKVHGRFDLRIPLTKWVLP